MILLGVDVGLSKTGIARAESGIAQPLTVIHEKDVGRLVRDIQSLVEKEGADKVVIGIPEGEIVETVNEVGEKLKDLGIDVEFQDETLTTHDAQMMAIEAGIPQVKRHNLEDAMAAAVMLQSYLDGN
ncbi:Holliday junction resolvase RuvX [Candidatus Microgenomates bacterium]|nr:Holliday junction resolvase RuvX [Candidatus Microgenomates bacterium]